MTLRLFIAPAAEPVSLAEAKLHLKVEHSVDDTLIAAIIQAAREAAEHETGRSLMPQTWELLLDAFPADAIKLDKPPVTSVVSVKYLDSGGVQQTLDGSAYTLDADYVPGYVLPAYGTFWPSTQDAINAVVVRFATGYANAAAVPAGIRAWMLLRIGALYGNREAFAAGMLVVLPGNFCDRLLDPYKVYA